jgi:hypothetical protein
MGIKPNIFRIATKELSQDGFFTWLLQWADKDNAAHNQRLNDTAKDFIKFLIQQQHEISALEIKKVDAARQWKNIDIWAEVNDEYFIVIEDKTNSAEHSEQLERYKNIAIEEYKGKKFKHVFIYLKTGNESLEALKKVSEKGYAIIDRKGILSVFNQREVHNNIFNEFREHLNALETQTNSFATFANTIADWKAAEGFFIKLQELLGGWTDWKYVPTQQGGFLAFCYHWSGTSEYNLFIQIENAIGSDIRLVIKIADWKPNLALLYQIFSDLQPYSQKHGLTLLKPKKYKPGKTSTLAVVQNAFAVDGSGNLDLNQFIQTLKKLEKILDEYSADKEPISIRAEIKKSFV